MKSQPVSEPDLQPHTVRQSVLLHLLPGVLVLLFFIIAAPIVQNLGLPLRFAPILSIFFVLIPCELGVLFYEGRKRNGRFSLSGIVVYRESIPRRQYFFWVPLLIAWSIIWSLLLSPLGNFLIESLFAWLPAWFIQSDISGFSRPMLIAMVTLYGIGNVAAAVVEELYFRGYLLPRLAHLKGWAPLVNSVLFALQHFLTPWQQLFIIIGVLPQAYLVATKRNIYLGILAHSILNFLSTILLIGSVFG